MARCVADYQICRIADQGNEEDGPDSRARGDLFYRNRRSADQGNEKVDRDPWIIYGYPPVYDEYEDEEWYYWMTGAGVTYDPTGDAIVNWVKKKTRPGVYNITTVEDAEKILTFEDKDVLAFFDYLVGPESGELVASSKLDDDVNIYQTVDPNVAKLFTIDPYVKHPSLVLIKKDVEKVTHHDVLFDKSAIQEFVFANKLSLVTTFSREIATLANDYVFDPGGSFLKLSKLEDEFFPKRGRMMWISLEDIFEDFFYLIYSI